MDSASAKQFVISRVIDQAQLEHIELSGIETKMLYFSEAHPPFADMFEVNTEFERDYDTEEYEDKVVGLLKSARERDISLGRKQDWVDALQALEKEDHYILVMVHLAFR